MISLPFQISEAEGQTKLQQLVHSITRAVEKGQLRMGDPLPSVNQLSKKSGFSRDTVFKAYSILKERNVIESAPQKGYFVAQESFKVFMLLDDFSSFKEQLYQSFRQNLPQSYSVDLLFHHYNPEVFQHLINNSLGRYSMYVLMNIEHKKMHPVLTKIDSGKLLVLDMGNSKNVNCNFLLQDFNQSVFKCLEQGREKLIKYEEIVLLYAENETPHPVETREAVERFCTLNELKFTNSHKLDASRLKRKQVYFVIRDYDLVEVIKTCRKNKLKIGHDVGVLSYNDTPMKQIVGGGISVISTNFEEMGRQAAEFVKSKQKIARVLPTRLILRDSL